jgi:hypothetical protein
MDKAVNMAARQKVGRWAGGEGCAHFHSLVLTRRASHPANSQQAVLQA